ncbi:MAG: hypothetical protein CL681_06870 [Blastopirellula sp.]|nr:hypothetical protein [Blastopirellula sp.]
MVNLRSSFPVEPSAVVAPERNLALSPAEGVEPIPGYLLTEKIGAGAYGEVWRAKAPGGLDKAIKFVYGTIDDVRAKRELNSLNRIKEVHHPFLLSLERIEVVRGQLIILTELAESCLKARFESYCEEGYSGIPRDELLDYLSDAADALDFLYEEHTLQHLDVKPENLLLIANRVKVADFGLLKDLSESKATLMGGMTPLYSPPEVFDGRPNRYSDQYSLAILYQELLTGVPPFNGRTAAQLAAQHLNSPPALTPLPIAEQPIVARALAKEARNRFPNCKALVEALKNPRNAEVNVVRGREDNPMFRMADEACYGEVAVLDEVAAERAPTLRSARVELKPFSELELAADDVQIHPTVFVGLGGTAGRILRKIRQRLCDRFGRASDVPMFQTLCIDSDVHALNDLIRGDDGSELSPRDTLAAPLRRPQDYREQKHELLEWISRRWLYNIPRSLQTEGLRPLGRLALVDHWLAVQQKLLHVIQQAMAADGIKQSARRTGFEVDAELPRIYLISSLNGGFGSGAVVDVAYWIRALMAERGISDRLFTGILTHATPRRSDYRDLSIANAVACLDELQHFSSHGQRFPGDHACQVPAFVDDHAAFRDTYVVHLGNDLNETVLEQSLDGVAEYLVRNTATKAAVFFDKARQLEHETLDNPLGERRVRSFGLNRFGAAAEDVSAVAVDKLCSAVLSSWADKYSVASETQQERYAKRCAALDIDLVALATKARNVANQFRDEHYLDALRASLSDVIGSMDVNHSQAVFSRVDQQLEVLEQVQVDGQKVDRRMRLEEAIGGIMRVRLDSVRENIWDLIDVPCERAAGALRATGWFMGKLARMEQDNEMIRQGVQQDLNELQQRFCQQVATLSKEELEVARNAQATGLGQVDLVDYVNLRQVSEIHDILQQVITRIKAEVVRMREDLENTAVQLAAFQVSFADPNKDADTEFIDTMLAAEFDFLLVEFEKELSERLFDTNSTLSEVLKSGNRARNDFLVALRTAARRVILKRASHTASMSLINEEASEQIFHDALQKAQPALMECGANYRLVVTAGNQRLCQQIQQQPVASQPTIVMDSDDEVVVCYELENIPLENIARGITGLRPDFDRLAARLHTRQDISWTTLLSGRQDG